MELLQWRRKGNEKKEEKGTQPCGCKIRKTSKYGGSDSGRVQIKLHHRVTTQNKSKPELVGNFCKNCIAFRPLTSAVSLAFTLAWTAEIGSKNIKWERRKKEIRNYCRLHTGLGDRRTQDLKVWLTSMQPPRKWGKHGKVRVGHAKESKWSA